MGKTTLMVYSVQVFAVWLYQFAAALPEMVDCLVLIEGLGYVPTSMVSS